MLASRVEPAVDSPARRRGLLGRASLPAGDALILAPCNSVHTCFMRFPIDVVFVARDGRIISMSRAVTPWRIRFALRAFAVIELPAGTLEGYDTRVNDILHLVAPDDSLA